MRCVVQAWKMAIRCKSAVWKWFGATRASPNNYKHSLKLSSSVSGQRDEPLEDEHVVDKNCMRVAIFGGTFDPIHIGHLILAEEAHFQLSLDQVYLVPAGEPPHKQDRRLT